MPTPTNGLDVTACLKILRRSSSQIRHRRTRASQNRSALTSPPPPPPTGRRGRGDGRGTQRCPPGCARGRGPTHSRGDTPADHRGGRKPCTASSTRCSKTAAFSVGAAGDTEGARVGHDEVRCSTNSGAGCVSCSRNQGSQVGQNITMAWSSRAMMACHTSSTGSWAASRNTPARGGRVGS